MKLEDYLRNTGMTQADYGLVINVSQSHVSKMIERGCLVDDLGWPHPKLIKRTKKGES